MSGGTLPDAPFAELENDMFERNVGTTDRAVRVVVGLALLAGFFVFPDAGLRWLFLIGVVPLATGLMGTCGLYSLIGVNTCPTGKS